MAATKLSKIQAEPEYVDLHFIDIEIMDGEWKDWRVTRRLLDRDGQGSCINKVLSTDALTNYHEKRLSTTMIIVDRHVS